MTEQWPGALTWCAVCQAHYVRSAADYTCVVCVAQKPCPIAATTPLAWLPKPVGP